MLQLELSNLLTVALAALALMGGMVAFIVRMYDAKLKDLSLRVDGAFRASQAAEKAAVDEEKNRILAVQALADARSAEHKDAFTRSYRRIEDLEKEVHQSAIQTQRQVSDLEVTVSSFGGMYVTKHELERCQDTNTGRHGGT